MGKTIKVNIKASQVIHFDQEVEMSIEEYEVVKDFVCEDIDMNRDSEAYGVIEKYINPTDIIDSDFEFTDVEVYKVKKSKSAIK